MLARNRIFQILPTRITEWNCSPCVANEQNKKALEKKRAKQHVARATLLELDKKHRELMLAVEHSLRFFPLHRRQDFIKRWHRGWIVDVLRNVRSWDSYTKRYPAGTWSVVSISSSHYCKLLRVLCPELSEDAMTIQFNKTSDVAQIGPARASSSLHIRSSAHGH